MQGIRITEGPLYNHLLEWIHALDLGTDLTNSLSEYKTNSLSEYKTNSLSEYKTNSLSEYKTNSLSEYKTNSLSEYKPVEYSREDEGQEHAAAASNQGHQSGEVGDG